jgi:pyrroloquinoline quinone biosynthesis protein D
MDAPEMTTDPATWRPRLPRGVRLHQDRVRGRVVLLAPERVLTLNGTAIEVLRRCDGERTLAAIVDELARTFDAPVAEVEAGSVALLADLAQRRIVEL